MKYDLRIYNYYYTRTILLVMVAMVSARCCFHSMPFLFPGFPNASIVLNTPHTIEHIRDTNICLILYVCTKRIQENFENVPLRSADRPTDRSTNRTNRTNRTNERTNETLRGVNELQNAEMICYKYLSHKCLMIINIYYIHFSVCILGLRFL